jgi:hypothetical protein
MDTIASQESRNERSVREASPDPLITINTEGKITDLKYLTQRTKSNPDLIMEMISLYLEQTPTLIKTMKQSLNDKDWDSLRTAAHKMIPSFSIMGISVEFENMTKQIQEYAGTYKHTERITDLVLQLENICTLACNELEAECNKIKKMK